MSNEKELAKQARWWIGQAIFAARMSAKHKDSPELREQFSKMAESNLARATQQVLNIADGK